MGAARREGMTLIEVMLAVAILSMVGTLLYSGFVQTHHHKERLERDLDRSHVIRMALDRMAREISMAFVSAHLNPSPALQTMRTAFVGTDRGSADRLDFTSFSHRRLFRDAHESDQNELSFFLTRSATDATRKVLARREDNRIDDDPLKGGRVEILVEDATSLEFEYFDPERREWIQTWDTTQPASQPNRLPLFVKVTLGVRHPRDANRTVTYVTRATVPLRYGLNHAIYNP